LKIKRENSLETKINESERISRKLIGFYLVFIIIFGIFIGYFIVIINPFGTEKYAISLYHFNSQFVPSVNDSLGVERNIINESIRAILEMYDRHPNWKFDVEISGVCLKSMYNNYSDVFNLLKKLVDRGQCELILSPFSEQLSIAFPYHDMAKSLELSLDLANKYNISVSNVLFLQENQFHTAFPILKRFGYEIFCVSGDTLEYFGVKNIAPVMEYSFLGNTIDLMVREGGEFQIFHSYHNIQYVFRWYGDGEASDTHSGFGTGDPEEFKVEPDRLQIHENRGILLESLGFKFVKISEWVNYLKSKNLYSKLSKPIPDSTWNMIASLGAYTWMGYNHKIEGRNETENDGHVRGENYLARNKLLVAESLFNYFNSSFNNSFRIYIESQLESAYEHLFLAEVSDSTGWKPRKEEWEYSYYHNQKVFELSDIIIKKIKQVVNITTAQIFTSNNSIINDTSKFKNITKSQISLSNLPINISVLGIPKNIIAYNITWMNYNFYSIEINITPSNYYEIKFDFDKSVNNITYSPSLAENITITLNKLDYIESSNWLLEQYNLVPKKVYLPLTNGLIYVNGIGIIRNNSKHYVAMCWDFNKGEIYQTEKYQEHNVSAEFFIMKSNLNNCLNLANIINTNPVKII